jgi:putative zinc finger/helix-turn-helix YgiT family protein
MKCPTCDVKTENGSAEVKRTVGGHVFVGEVTASSCPKCGEVYYDGQALERLEVAVARELAERGLVSGAAFKFMRKALGMRAADLAELLDVAAETVSRWETGERPVDRAAWTALGGLVVDRFEGRDRVISILRALDAPRKQPKNIRVDSHADKRKMK